MRVWERIYLIRRIDIQMRSKKESNLMSPVNQQTPKMKNGKVSTYLSIITLNVNYLNSPIKRCSLAE
jgi:hypothetical protein